MYFQLSEEQELIQANMREFCAEYVDPIAVEIDENSRWPAEVFEKLSEMGWMGMTFPTEYGGAGLDYVTYAIVAEEIARSSASVCLDYCCHILGSLVINNYGTEQQKQKYLVPLTQGQRFGCFAITEPGAGTDVGALTTTAVLDGDNYILNGVKTFITNGPTADTFIILAYTDKSKGPKGLSTFIVTKDSPGFRVGDHFKKMGLKSSQTSELVFKDCLIPKENLLGGEGNGLKIAMASLDHGRIGIASQAIGIAQAALDESISYSKQRVQFGKPIAKNQAIQWMIANMETDIEAARLLTHRAASLKDQGQPFSKEAAMAKLFATEMANKHASKAVQIHGGYGYMKGVKVERLMRDVKITEIYEGTSEAMRMIIAGAALR
jgi:butyryl-CoA dehydrogenase